MPDNLRNVRCDNAMLRNLRSWWENTTAEAFVRKTDCLVSHYNAMTMVSDDTNHTRLGSVNGQLTLGENIADHGGMSKD